MVSNLSTWVRHENGDYELYFVWVTDEMIGVINSMMRNQIRLEVAEIPRVQLRIKEVRVYWDVEPWKKVETMFGGLEYINAQSHRNMDVLCDEG